MQRIVSVYLPQWPIERLQIRARQDLRASPLSSPRTRVHTKRRNGGRPGEGDLPLVLIDDRAHGLFVHAVNARARVEGVREGETLADVRARVPGLLTQPADPAGDQAALEALALWCGRYGPAVNTDGPRGDCRALWIDITGVAHLFGGEERLLADLSSRLTAFGLSVRVGLASTLAAASALARFAPQLRLATRIAPPDGLDRETAQGSAQRPPPGVAAILAPLPIEALRLDPEPLLLLRRLGLKRIGHLYDLPRAALKRRFPAREAAQAVLLRLDQALGAVPEPLVPLRPLPQHVVYRAFSAPLISNEALRAALASMIEELCALFAAQHRGARLLVLTLYRSDGTYLEQSAGFSAPTRKPVHIARLLEEHLDRIDARNTMDGDSALLGLGIDALGLAAHRTQELPPVQTGILPAAGDPPASLAALVDRLVNRLGPQRVHRLEPRASHIPERAQRLVPALEPAMARQRLARSGKSGCESVPHGTSAGRGPPRPCLLLSPPEPILVTAEIPEGAPVRFIWRRVARRVVVAQGPERIAPEWWRALVRRPGRPGHEPGDAEPEGAPKFEDSGPIAARHGQRTRDYYQLEDDGGGRYWVFRDGLYQERGEEQGSSPHWYMHGLYA